jgi:hypothetical protein
MAGTNGFGQPNGQALTQEQQLAQQAAQMQQHLNGLVEQNKAGFAELARRGIQFDPGTVLSARLDSLIQSVAEAFGPPGQLWAIQARISFEQQVAEQQQAAGEQGRKAQLGLGASFTPSMIRQLAAETGFSLKPGS